MKTFWLDIANRIELSVRFILLTASSSALARKAAPSAESPPRVCVVVS